MITSLSFVLFLFCVYVVFYIVPRKAQWIVLLIASLGFYYSCSRGGILYVIFSAVITYISARIIRGITLQRKSYIRENKAILSKEEKTAYKKRMQNKSRCIMILALILNFGLLLSAKYWLKPVYGWTVPLGISFYTLQFTGYIVDVYWENISAEENFFKVLLFVSFFPQMTQGPISDFEQLSGELFKEHTLSYERSASGFMRMTWGYFKKMVVADTLAPYVLDAFSNVQNYNSLALIVSAFLFMTQLYMDFSGYMDIMCGFAEMLGIRMAENFNRPFFSKSVSEFWRRWHMTLGAWLRKYIYYPIAGSDWAMEFGEKIRAKDSQLISASIALLAVWLTTGLWHAFSWPYVVWGMLNGVVIIISLWLEPAYAKAKNALHIKDESKGWRAFRIIRTSVLITLFEIIAGSNTVKMGLEYLTGFLGKWRFPRSVTDIIPHLYGQSFLFLLMFVLAFFGIVLQFAVSLYEERNHITVNEVLLTKSPAWRIALLAVMIFLIVIFGVEASWDAGGFMYANF